MKPLHANGKTAAAPEATAAPGSADAGQPAPAAEPSGQSATLRSGLPANPSGGPTVYLLDPRDRFELGLLRQWPGPQANCVEIGERADPLALSALLQEQPQAWLLPLRLAWLAQGAGESEGLFSDLTNGRRVQPGPIRRRWLARHRPERMAVAIADGAFVADLARRWQQRAERDGATQDFAGFVTTQALLALERAERRLRGARYRVARLLPGEVFSERAFQQELIAIGRDGKESASAVRIRATRYLREMAAMVTPFSLDVIMAIYRASIRSNHDPGIDFNRDQLRELDALMASRSVVFLISHKSMLDTIALSVVLFDANMPVPLTFGGINLKTFGVGVIARSAGIIFLRRAFQDNLLYRAVFRRYIDYLIEKRFALLWALEGTRSRTGKLQAPRYGLFRYVLDASLRTDNRDLAWVPVSVAYDQITEVDDYANEQRGLGRQREGMGWMLRFFRRGRSSGRIFVRIGRPFGIDDLAVATPTPAIAAQTAPTERHELVRRVALESALRLNAATPVTASAIMTLILLGAGRRAQRLSEIQVLARAGVALLRRRKVEIVGPHDFRNIETVRGALNPLVRAGVLCHFDEGLERLVSVAPNQHHKAAYYRNTAIHWFVMDAIAELALQESAATSATDRIEAFYRHAEALREMLIFDFYFPPRALFRKALANGLDDRYASWQSDVTNGGGERVIAQLQPLFAPAVLRSITDAYRVVATLLVRRGDMPVSRIDASLLGQTLKLGRQMLLQEVLVAPESVSRSLYETAYRLADRRGLLQLPETHEPLADANDDRQSRPLAARRRQWLIDLAGMNSRLDRIAWLILSRASDEF